MRHADQLPVGEHRARTLAAVVEHHVDAQREQLAMELLGRLAHRPLRSMPIGQITTVNGAIASGQMMPRASWFCSIAAAGRRVTPMP